MTNLQNKDDLPVLICPLNWGLGHATRVIPIVNTMIAEGKNIILACDDLPFDLLKDVFHNHREVKMVRFPGKKVTYSRGKDQFFKLFLQAPGLLWSVFMEKRWIEKFIKDNPVSLIISDNRYGASSKRVYSVFLGHQLNIPLPRSIKWLKGVFRFFNHHFIRQFNHCVVPDFVQQPGLSGVLSHGDFPFPVKYCGPLTRFAGNDTDSTEEHPVIHKMKQETLVAIVSGPEPQRTIFEELIIKHLHGRDLILFRGIPGQNHIREEGRTMIVNHASARVMFYAMKNAEVVIARSGYSTLMDIFFTKAPCILIPTPGQTEQEYLANLWQEKNLCISLKQNEMNLIDNILKENIIPVPVFEDSEGNDLSVFSPQTLS